MSAGWYRILSLLSFFAGTWLPEIIPDKLTHSPFETMVVFLLLAILFALFEVATRIMEVTHGRD